MSAKTTKTTKFAKGELEATLAAAGVRNRRTNDAAVAYSNHLRACATCAVARKHDLRAECGMPCPTPATDFCDEGKALHATYLAVRS